MAKSTKIIPTLITEVPLTAEAREAMLDAMFMGSLPNHGELFVPDDKFYINDRGPKQARHMLLVLCHWLGIKPGYIGLEFEAVDGPVPDGQRYTIYLETKVLWDEFLLGRALAYALTRYLLEEQKQVHLSSADQPALLATASVVFGLGVVIVNGLSPTYGWFDGLKQWLKKSAGKHAFDGLFISNYEYLLQGFIKSHHISPAAYSHSLTPWAAKKLASKNVSRPTHAVLEARHKTKLANIKLLGVVWLAILAIGIGSFALINKVRPASARVTTAQEHSDLLSRLTKDCKDRLAYQRQYADLTDIQTVRSLNSVSLRCQSLDSQYQAAQQAIGHQ